METLKQYFSPDRRATLKKRSMSGMISLLRGLFLAGVCFTVLYPFFRQLFFYSGMFALISLITRTTSMSPSTSISQMEGSPSTFGRFCQ